MSRLGRSPLGKTCRFVSWSRSYGKVAILISTASLRDGFVVLSETHVSRIFQCVGTKGPAFTSLPRDYVFNWPDTTFIRVPHFWTTTWKCAGGSRCEGRWWFMGLISVASEQNTRSMPSHPTARELLVLPEHTLLSLLNVVLRRTLSNHKTSKPLCIATFVWEEL